MVENLKSDLTNKVKMPRPAPRVFDDCNPIDHNMSESNSIGADEICLIYATLGRPEVLSQSFKFATNQNVRPALTIISCANLEDVGDLRFREDVQIVLGDRGSSRQRNAALNALPDRIKLVVFFDDDFIPHPKWTENVLRVFNENCKVGSVTGSLLADGIKGPGISLDEASKLISAADPRVRKIDNPYSPYGCNMAFRRSMIEHLRFDEKLVLYGWLEDRDFGAIILQRGFSAVKTSDALGVHLGVKHGRTTGIRLGYSQVVNPIYLYFKGTMALSLVLRHVFSNLAANIVMSVRPESYIDRRGRLQGNLLGIIDLILGCYSHEKAARL